MDSEEIKTTSNVYGYNRTLLRSRIQNGLAVRCADSIPQELPKTRKLTKNCKVPKKMKNNCIEPEKKTEPSILIQMEKGKYKRIHGPAIHTYRKTRNPILGQILFEKHDKRLEKEAEDKRWKIEKLEENKIKVEDLIFEIDFNNYIKEEDVTLPFLEVRDNFVMPPLPKGVDHTCKNPSCLLGCVCQSIRNGKRGRSKKRKFLLADGSKKLKKKEEKKNYYGDIKFRLRNSSKSFFKCDCMKTKVIEEKNIKYRLRGSRRSGNKCICCDKILRFF